MVVKLQLDDAPVADAGDVRYHKVLCLVLAVPYGRYMARVFSGEKNLLTPVFRPIERAIYRFCGIDESQEMS